ncbi:MAG: putative alpha/beta superfamily hydrolase [Rhodothermales bacterium]|jgi:predicted alpha/beta superfamily hydrolase
MRPLPLLLLLTSACSISSDGGLTTFEVDMSQEIDDGRFSPDIDRVGVRGSVSPLSWSESLIAEDPDGDSVYTVKAALPISGEPARYKFKVEGTEPSEGWEAGPDRLVSRTGAGERITRAFNDGPPDAPSRLTGTIKAHPGVESAFLDYPRDVWVYLPPNYGRSADRYPVLYLQDGHAVFDSWAGGFEWGADETAEALIAEGAIEPIIIVGVSATPGRISEYTPSAGSVAGGDTLGGKGPDYVRFLTEELKALIDAQYRTIPGRAAVGGSSLGGLISIYAGLARPDVFDGVLAASPSVWWDEESILSMVRESAALPSRIWVDVGSEEGPGMVSGAESLAGTITSRQDNVEVHLEIAPGASHHELAWSARFPDMLRFLYEL